MARNNSLKLAPYGKAFVYHDEHGMALPTPRAHWELIGYVAGWAAADIDWRPNEPFEAELRLRTFHRGRSSVTFEFVEEASDVHYPMFVSDVFMLMKFGEVSQGVVSGKWQAVKRGANYGLAPVGE